jgi:predicted GH43/DUF377 family glycosyl hydrolase
MVKSFIPGRPEGVVSVIGRALALSEDEVQLELEAVYREFGARHDGIQSLLLKVFLQVESQVFTQRALTPARRELIGAFFAGEYALEAAALFNPSIVPHPDQDGVEPGGLRFVLSLRATGEGHVSSIEFRQGVVSSGGEITIEPAGRYVTLPEVVLNPTYRKQQFLIKLHEMGFQNPGSQDVLAALSDDFTRSALTQSVSEVLRREPFPTSNSFQRTMDAIQWLADSNYELQFSPSLAVDQRIIFPVSSNESNGMEDARFVRFVEDDGKVVYYATYTAYNGRAILPQLIETTDFLHFRMITLNGSAVQNKGMALFPRRIKGRYAMLSRQDDENLFLLLSDHPHYWSDPHLILRPSEVWESVKVGNCGSPIETRAGWLVITHGVGPMRKYSIGAILLDLENPTRVIGRLKDPLLAPENDEWEGYVPNVVYSCGALVHGGRLVLPYAVGDRVTRVASIDLEELLQALGA